MQVPGSLWLNVGALLVLDEVAGKVRLLPIPRT
jgi:hypothetical protein